MRKEVHAAMTAADQVVSTSGEAIWANAEALQSVAQRSVSSANVQGSGVIRSADQPESGGFVIGVLHPRYPS